VHAIAASEVTKATIFMKLKIIKKRKDQSLVSVGYIISVDSKVLLMVSCQNGQTLSKLGRISLSLVPYLASGSVIVNVDPTPRVLSN
jgi:hypothetical protein